MPAKPVLILCLLALSGCTAAGGATVFRGDFVAYDAPANPRCDNYARQTYYNALEDYSDRGDSLSARMITKRNAERMADRAYQRCLEGRLN